MSGQNGADRDKSVELVYGGAAAADQPTEGDVGDIVARAKSALEDSYHVLHGSELVTELVAEVERLRRWKDEAAEVLIGMQDLGRELNAPLGQRITGEGAAEAARAIVGERDRLAATVERVRELSMQVAHDPDVEGMTLRDIGAIGHALAVLAALEGPDTGEGDPS